MTFQTSSYIDRLASEGIVFLNSYVTQASCSPSRSSLFTGLYPHQTGGRPNEPVGQIGLAYNNSGYSMAPRVVTLPQLLKAQGYRTGIIGKLHVYPETSFNTTRTRSEYFSHLSWRSRSRFFPCER
ncbi:sulfatase-like hydrolase/transferase [Gloeocapsopsis crepidinum LEGE 06123]|uniref:Sulfatase-like hydrolase/transferase n=1 Tax=Gloeocapsopsis crepidinum LEGE 06123 TaxID=588587 RepID=A0ABR9V139_9CHRO|nr:sulfatase-like hydrolase/transferase [Gloeocapsopsis crepidinum]MBE9193525.1 sulfatase-like hydrolase/transferase [Gloeocapsopsis crepidinum LEGE 06123]